MKFHETRAMTSAIGLATLWAMAPAPAHAQDSGQATPVDEIVVTAQRREELSRDVPISPKRALSIDTAAARRRLRPDHLWMAM